MPTIQNSTRGQVVQIWGKAYIRGTDGVWRPLAVGETVPQGSEMLTEQDAIVMITRSEVAVPKIAESLVESAVEFDHQLLHHRSLDVLHQRITAQIFGGRGKFRFGIDNLRQYGDVFFPVGNPARRQRRRRGERHFPMRGAFVGLRSGVYFLHVLLVAPEQRVHSSHEGIEFLAHVNGGQPRAARSWLTIAYPRSL